MFLIILLFCLTIDANSMFYEGMTAGLDSEFNAITAAKSCGSPIFCMEDVCLTSKITNVTYVTLQLHRFESSSDCELDDEESTIFVGARGIGDYIVFGTNARGVVIPNTTARCSGFNSCAYVACKTWENSAVSVIMFISETSGSCDPRPDKTGVLALCILAAVSTILICCCLKVRD